MNKNTEFDLFEKYHRDLLEIAIKKYPKVFKANDLLHFDMVMFESKRYLNEHGLLKHWKAIDAFESPEDFLPQNSTVLLERYSYLGFKNNLILKENLLLDETEKILNEGLFSDLSRKISSGVSLIKDKFKATERAEKNATQSNPAEVVGAMKFQGEAIEKIKNEIKTMENGISSMQDDDTKKADFQNQINQLKGELAPIEEDYKKALRSGWMQKLVGRIYGAKQITEQMELLPSIQPWGAATAKIGKAAKLKASAAKGLLIKKQALAAAMAKKKAAIAAVQAAKAAKLGGIGAKIAGAKIAGGAAGAGAAGAGAAGAGAAGAGAGAAGAGGGAAAAGGGFLASAAPFAAVAGGAALVAALVGAGVAGARLKARREKIEDLLKKANSISAEINKVLESNNGRKQANDEKAENKTLAQGTPVPSPTTESFARNNAGDILRQANLLREHLEKINRKYRMGLISLKEYKFKKAKLEKLILREHIKNQVNLLIGKK